MTLILAVSCFYLYVGFLMAGAIHRQWVKAIEYDDIDAALPSLWVFIAFAFIWPLVIVRAILARRQT